MLHATQVMLETEDIERVDAIVTIRQRSAYIRGAVALRLALEEMEENHTLTLANVRGALDSISTGDGERE